MVYAMLVSIRKVYDVKRNCDSCGDDKGNRYGVFSVDQGCILRFVGYYCAKCITKTANSFYQEKYNTVPFPFLNKLIKLNKVVKRQGDRMLDEAINNVLTHVKAAKKPKKAR